MTQSNVEERIKPIIAEHLGIDDEAIVPNASFVDDLGCDSLDVVELVMALEDEFDIEIPDEEVEKLVTVGDLAAYIAKKTMKAA